VARPRVVVIGATGQLGGDLVETFARIGRWEVVGLSHEDIEVTHPGSVRAAITAWRPSVVINTVAFNRPARANPRPPSG
jgi:dTDP-4-dehydrorhamnose reductase